MSIATVAALKAQIPGLAGADDDAELAVELARAESQVAAWAGWPVADSGAQSFSTATYTIYVDGPMHGSPRLLLLPLPQEGIQSVTSAHASVTDTFDGTTLVPSSDYRLDKLGLWLLANATRTWVHQPRGNRVILVGGWDEGDAPETVVAAVLAQARHRWMMRATAGTISASVGGNFTSRPEAVAGVCASARETIAISPAMMWGAACGG